MTITKLKKLLKRGVKVKVRDTFDKDELHGSTVYVKSKKLSDCKRRSGQCAEDRICVGLSVFVCRVDPTIEVEGPKGAFRAGAYKICLSHLTTEAGEDLLRQKPIKQAAAQEIIEMGPIAVVETVTWEALAHIAQAAQVGAKKSGQDAIIKLIKLSRSLMTTTEKMKTSLILAQEKLLMVQDAAIQELMGIPEELPVSDEELKTKEERPIMGFSPNVTVEEKE